MGTERAMERRRRWGAAGERGGRQEAGGRGRDGSDKRGSG